MLSIIIPCFNHTDTLRRAVASAETVRGVGEIIIVDDCSTDEACPAQITSLCAEFPRVRGMRNEVNSGPGASRNRGVRESTGTYVTFLDADDELINPAFFEEALEVMEQDSRIRAVKANMEFFDPVKGWLLPAYDPRYVSVILSSSCAMVIKTDAFMIMGGFPESPLFRGQNGGEDVAFMQALMGLFDPLGKVNTTSYRVWSREGSHLDRFLATTRMSKTSFEFVGTATEDLVPLESAINDYKAQCAIRVASKTNSTSSVK